jgi:hypothetical protein
MVLDFKYTLSLGELEAVLGAECVANLICSAASAIEWIKSN